MRRSRSAASIPRSSGAARGCRRSGSPTPTAPGSPTVRRRRRHRCWRAPRIIQAPRWRRVRPVPTHRRRTCCHGRGTRCPARESTRCQVPSVLTGHTRFARCPLVTAEPQRPAPDTGDPDRRATGRLRRQTFRAHRCRSRRGRQERAPSRWDPPVRFRRRRRSRRGCRLDRRRRQGLETSFRLRSSRRAKEETASQAAGEAAWEVTKGEHRL